MNNNKNTGINLDSKDAVYFALIQQIPQLLGIVLVASVGLPILFWMFGNLNTGNKLAREWNAVYGQCKRVNINRYGRYNHNDCYEWAQQQVPGRWARSYSASTDTRAVEHLSNR